MKVAIASIVIMSMYKQILGEILRLPCGTHANFSVIYENQRLRHHTFLTLMETDKPTCQYECGRNRRCKSINVNEDEYICELNEKSADDLKDNVTTNLEVGWTSYSPSYNETLVGLNCRERNPCKADQKCMDICECPGYRCIDKFKAMNDTSLNWTDARKRCKEFGGDLASIINREEEAKIEELLHDPNTWFWIGLNDLTTEGDFKWSDGMPRLYSNFGPSEGYQDVADTEDCFFLTRGISPNDLYWYDAPCNEMHCFVCRFF